MVTKFIENLTASPRFVGGRMIPPGEGRDIDVALLPPEERDAPLEPEAPAAPTVDQVLAELLAKGLKPIGEALPDLSNEALDRVLELEGQAEHPRKGLLTLVDAERLRRANASIDGEAAAKARAELELAEGELLAAIDNLDHEPDVLKHPELETARNEAQARVDVLRAALA